MAGVLETEGYASFEEGIYFEPFKYRLPDLRKTDLLVEVLYCGLCHSDVFLAKEDWGSSLTLRPLVAGHEVIGRVLQRGPSCQRFEVSEMVGIGFISEACGGCEPCSAQYPAGCEGRGFISTFSAVNIYREDRCLGTGGFGHHMVIHENYAVKLPQALLDDRLPYRVPLLCSGLAIWTSLRNALRNYKPGNTPFSTSKPLTIAVVGVGTAGHIAAQIVTGLRHRLLCISSSPRKEFAVKRLCPAAEFIVLSDDAGLAKHTNKVDIILDCSPGLKKLHHLMQLLAYEGSYIALSIPPETHIYGMDQRALTRKRITLSGAFMGRQTDLEELLQWVAEVAPNVCSKAKLLPLASINEAVQLVDKNTVFDGEHFSIVFDLTRR
eukprot:Protomagalhaensia_sp_Gyna_25__892@NODE_142_length_4920_cov_484_660930_g112_i0_p2_GENE_NODE_142_length_4920_cov_484_660930_g112_i0NODE_142_length_4920_cov_484_660930_g112_i0_p2_ORF_typecomplete_len379_score54_11ADH_N/PF08240_12/8_6e19ADH_N/PF08240_12/5_4e03ADH_zinc_N/PF00107_26/1_1e08Glu_dehyd_C/PF16912_5/1_2e08ADH_zinc_N_2/PF13602_6/5_2e07AlaDh_PNT_C/PF01262_21/0_00322Hacid_dh_C/PF02826_19/0_017ELFV_dehydrog/PF00208_21/0_36_NODE_142_length_4920_cov_484_660930_g112_i01361272